jgi:hypothetical protein
VTVTFEGDSLAIDDEHGSWPFRCGKGDVTLDTDRRPGGQTAQVKGLSGRDGLMRIGNGQWLSAATVHPKTAYERVDHY